MLRTGLLLLISASIGYVTSAWTGPPAPFTGSLMAQSQAPAGGRGGPGISDIQPVPNPPLYPDPNQPKKPMHYSVDLVRRIHEVRKANALRGNTAQPAPGDPVLQGQSYRTHHFGVSSSGYGITHRQKYETPRPSPVTGVMSYYEDADQHEGVTDFLILVGGGGQFVVDGEIENREYGRDPWTQGRGVPPRNTGNVRPLLLGEFHGQPLKGGHVYDAKAGDWLIVPPGVPHWWLPTPREGMSYLIVKVNIGLYPTALID